MPNLKPIRRGQLITPFGVGALVDFPGDESLMTAGLDEWPSAKDECPRDWLVREERLQARLEVTHFRLPPDYRKPGRDIQHPNKHIPFVRFPLWHYCPRRGAMERLSLFGGRQKCPCRPGLDCESLPRWKRPHLIPSRFIAVCPKGHIEDFPFMEWVHGDGNWDQTHKLRLLPGRSSASLSGIKIKCSCGKTKSMTGAFNFNPESGGELHRIGYDCSGGKPWLGVEGRHGQCGEYLRVVQRGASNVYFPRTVSSIYLPLWARTTAERSIRFSTTQRSGTCSPPVLTMAGTFKRYAVRWLPVCVMSMLKNSERLPKENSTEPQGLAGQGSVRKRSSGDRNTKHFELEGVARPRT